MTRDKKMHETADARRAKESEPSWPREEATEWRERECAVAGVCEGAGWERERESPKVSVDSE